jgi:peptidoglycan/LPS O-acetylase OafA/YrhL
MNKSQAVGPVGESHRIPSLDGLRAISIALVFAHHVAGTPHSPIPAAVANQLALGELGVRVFFVISGFLITGLLLKELDKHQHIRLGRFYFRRTMRIFPPYYAFVLALIVLQAMGWIELLRGDVLHALTYTSNYHPVRSWNTGHTWSLAVEEQFYLLWPAVLLMAGRRRGLMIAASLILICPFLRLALSAVSPEIQSGIGHRFETMADALAVGCLLAGMRGWLKQQPLYNWLLRSRLFIFVPVVVVAANLMHDHWRAFILVGFTVMNIGIALTIDWCVTNYTGRVGKLLNAGPMVYVGVISYSLYLWQQIFLNRTSEAVANTFPLNIGLAILMALASFYLIERPSLALRQRLEKKWFGSDTRTAASPVPIIKTEATHQPVSDVLIVTEADGLSAIPVTAVAGDPQAR